MPSFELDEAGNPVQRPAPSLNPLTGLRERIEAHWKEYLPKMYAALVESGELAEALSSAVKQTKAAYHDAMESGLNSPSAWEAVREEWAFLPAESDSQE